MLTCDADLSRLGAPASFREAVDVDIFVSVAWPCQHYFGASCFHSKIGQLAPARLYFARSGCQRFMILRIDSAPQFVRQRWLFNVSFLASVASRTHSAFDAR